jgi:hypothetical protein
VVALNIEEITGELRYLHSKAGARSGAVGCTTNREVAGSILDGVTGIFH